MKAQPPAELESAFKYDLALRLPRRVKQPGEIRCYTCTRRGRCPQERSLGVARAIAPTPVLEGQAAKAFDRYLDSARPDPKKAERVEAARIVYREMQARATERVEKSR